MQHVDEYRILLIKEEYDTNDNVDIIPHEDELRMSNIKD